MIRLRRRRSVHAQRARAHAHSRARTRVHARRRADRPPPLVTQTSPCPSARSTGLSSTGRSSTTSCAHCIVPGQMTNVHHAYRAALKYWKRRLGPVHFRRRSRISSSSSTARSTRPRSDRPMFALWTYRTGVLKYVTTHLDAVRRTQTRVSQRQKRVRPRGAPQRRAPEAHGAHAAQREPVRRVPAPRVASILARKNFFFRSVSRSRHQIFFHVPFSTHTPTHHSDPVSCRHTDNTHGRSNDQPVNSRLFLRRRAATSVATWSSSSRRTQTLERMVCAVGLDVRYELNVVAQESGSYQPASNPSTRA